MCCLLTLVLSVSQLRDKLHVISNVESVGIRLPVKGQVAAVTCEIPSN